LALIQINFSARFDRVPFKIEEILPLNPAITVVSKDETGKWAATVVDILRDPLDGKVRPIEAIIDPESVAGGMLICCF